MPSEFRSESHHGFDPARLLTIQWQWIPEPPRPRDQALPPISHRDDALFLAASPTATEMETYRFSFPQLSKQTPDLRFYRLIQIFNTPLLALTTREAGQSEFAYWRGEFPRFRSDFHWAYFWFFRDQNDGDAVVVEYAFDGGMVLYSESKSPADLQARYAEIVKRVGA